MPTGTTGAAPASGPSGGGPAIDPVKIVKKYLWLLIAAGVFGIALGVAAFLGLRKVAPQYTSEAVFEVIPIQGAIDQVNSTLEDEERLARFMATEAATMTSSRILTAVIENPAMRSGLPEWYEPFMDGPTLDTPEALKALTGAVSASPASNTSFIALKVKASKPVMAQQLTQFVYETYNADQISKSNGPYAETRERLNNSIRDTTEQIEAETRRRKRLVVEGNIQNLNPEASQAAQALRTQVLALAQLEETKTAAEVQLEEYRRVLASPAGVTYPEDILGQVEQLPAVQQFQQQIRASKARDLELENGGLGENHRERLAVSAQISALEDELDVVREEEASRLFNQQIDSLRLLLRQVAAREAEILETSENLTAELNEITRTIQDIMDIDRTIVSLQEYLSQLKASEAELAEIVSTGGVARIRLVQRPTLPSSPSFPSPIQIIPVGFLLVVGLVGGLVVLKEVTDQRVKGPADIAMIPRTRVLGIIPDIAQDPARPERAETTFRDHPHGVFAEAVRQLRAPLLKRCAQQGHKTVLVVPSTPGSGSTTVIANLAEACSRADMRVLVVDANFRRPGLHEVYNEAEGPGLADCVTNKISLDQAIRKTDSPNLDLLPAGSPAQRAFEGIAAQRMEEVIHDLRHRYDLVLFDVAPAIVSGDALGLANRCDASVLVARAFNEKRGMVARLKNNLVEAKGEFLGVVVNAVKASAGGYFKQNMQATHEYQARPAKADKHADKPEADAA